MNKTVRIMLKPKEDREISQGFPWVYDNEISTVKFPLEEGMKTSSLEECAVEDGTIVEVYSNAGGFLGSGVINKKSKITVRMISSLHADKILENMKSFWAKKIRDAVNIRNLSFKSDDSCRLVFGEADFIPGLIVEKYVSKGKLYLVVQFLALACEKFRNEILSSLKDFVKPDLFMKEAMPLLGKKKGLQKKQAGLARQDRK